jgi:HEAT repeat protein
MTTMTLLFALLCQSDERNAGEAVERFKETFRAATSAAERAKAVPELSKTVHEKTFAKLLPLMGAEEKEVRAAAVRALGDFASYRKPLTPALLSLLSGSRKEPEVRGAILETLAKLADPASFVAIHALLRDQDLHTAQSAIVCVGTMRQKESIDPLVELLRDIQRWTKTKQAGPYRDERGQKGEPEAAAARLQGIQTEILKALKAITLEPWATPIEWEIWWNRHKATFEVPSKPEEKIGRDP